VPYGIALGLIVWLPASEASKATGIVFEIARWVSELTGIDPTTASTVFEFLANIVLFVPLGLLVSVAWPRMSWWLTMLTGLVTTLVIEVVQTMMPSRVPAVSDVVGNAAGTAIGALFVAAHRAKPRAPGPRPRRARRRARPR